MTAAVSARTYQWAVLATAAILVVGGAVVTWHTSVSHPGAPLYSYFREGLVNAPATLALAALLTLGRPGHRITWTFVAMAACAGVQLFAGAYAHEALATPASGSVTAMFLSAIAQSGFVMTWLLLVLLFPTGDVISSRWRILVWAAFAAVPLVVIIPLLAPQPFADEPGFEAVSGPLSAAAPAGVLTVISGLGGGLAVGALVGGVAQLFVRFRRGSAQVRLQLAWFFYAVVIAVLVLLVPWPGRDRLPGWLLWSLAPLGIWTAVAVAILKHRLYDIDLVVNRTLVYGALTALLGAIYLSSVVVLQALLKGVTAESDVAIAASTLTVAALFRPLRSRVQAFIDQRFYRRKYDASQTLGEFSVRLRNQLDLDNLGHDLVAVVVATMQPAHVSIWLREPAGRTR